METVTINLKAVGRENITHEEKKCHFCGVICKSGLKLLDNKDHAADKESKLEADIEAAGNELDELVHG